MVFTRRWISGEYRNTMYLVTSFDMSNVDYHNQGAACVKRTKCPVEVWKGNPHG